MKKSEIKRRELLKSLSLMFALPSLTFAESLLAATPRRVLFVYLPNGASWTPEGLGIIRQLPQILSPLESLKDYVTIVSGLKLEQAIDKKAGDHARAGASFLTGVKPAYPGPGVRRSVDLLLADKMGGSTPFANLFLGGEGQAGSDAGYIDSYQSHVSWISEKSPATKETSPKAVFERLFGRQKMSQMKSSQAEPFFSDKLALEFAISETKTLRDKLPAEDRQKLEQYLASLLDLEKSFLQSEGQENSACRVPSGFQSDGLSYDLKIRQFYDLVSFAFECNLTRVVTFMLANEASNINYPFAGVRGSHHEISHDTSKEGQESLGKIVNWHVKELARFIEKLRKTPEGSGTMLDHTLVLFGGGIADGAKHTHENLPLLVVGRSPGLISGGRHINAQNASLSALHLTLSKALGHDLGSLGGQTSMVSLT